MIEDNFVDPIIKKQLAELGILDQEKRAEYLADKSGLPYIDLRMKAPDLDALAKLPLEDAQKFRLAAFHIADKQLHIAIADPTDESTLTYLRNLDMRRERPIVYVASPNSINHVHDRYKDIDTSTVTERGIINLGESHLLELLKNINTLKDFRKSIEDTARNERRERISKIIELTVAGAIHFEASDIHIEPEEKVIRVRFRIDGNLQDVYYTDEKTYSLMNSRLKLLAGMKLTTTAKAQDGRFSIDFGGDKIEVRVSLVPGAYGESYVCRILDPKAANVPFEALGMSDVMYRELEKALRKPFGMILNTGPTGSGKSTTLYACLKKVYRPEVKIMTIEDPIEYHINGIVQTQVEVKKDYTFLSGLRAALRQDPDIIMVGEIRDEDTAKVAAQASLTGHIVLSTLHTNSAAGAIPRLINLGVDPKTLGSSLTLVMAQRLCRKLCKVCKVETTTNAEESKLITNILGDMMSSGKDILGHTPQMQYKMYKPNPDGCDACNGGYKGRIGIFEGIVMDKKIEDVSRESGGERDIRDAGKEQKIPTMREDGILKILSGITSMDEVSLVVDMYEL